MALMHCGQCVPVRALGRRWDATHVIVYLPFHFQMALSGENVLLDTLSLSLPLLTPSPSTIPPVAHSGAWTVFQVQNTRHEVRGKVAKRARKADWDLRGSPGKSGGSLGV